MVFKEVSDAISSSLSSLRTLVPEGMKVLFECLLEPDEDLTYFSECYVLIGGPQENGEYPVVSELHISAVAVDTDPCTRLREVRQWLAERQAAAFLKNCDSVREAGGVFIPNRFPPAYTFYGNEVSFVQVL